MILTTKNVNLNLMFYAHTLDILIKKKKKEKKNSLKVEKNIKQ